MSIQFQPQLNQQAYMQSSNSRFTFGQPTATSPSFHLGSASSAQISPVSEPGHRDVAEGGLWNERQALEYTNSEGVSPFLQNRHILQNRPSESFSTPSLQNTPDSKAERVISSDSQQSSPEPAVNLNPKKRKGSAEDMDGSDTRENPAQMPIKKTAHNMIEKRYRTNLNDKIALLRDSVPSLRVMSRSTSHGEEEDDGEDLEGLAPAHKLNKATVLSKATEYIGHLEKRNRRLAGEMATLKARLDHLEKMAITGSMVISSAGSTPDDICFPDDMFPVTPGTSVTQGPVRGMIPVPDNIANLRQGQVTQAPYGISHSGYSLYPNNQINLAGSGAGQAPMSRGRSGFMNKLMVGSLAGLMLFEGFAEREQSGTDIQGRGLFAFPVSILEHLAHLMVPSMSNLGIPSQSVLMLLKVVLILSAFGYILSPLFDFRPRPKKSLSAIRLSPAPSLASPVELRQKAWLTAIQTVWVPRHSFLLEVSALCLKTLKLSARRLVGWKIYASLTSITKEQETARVKAWEIALDAQLTGGDAEISMSRLVLTLLASGTLPDTPGRLMLKALHIRIIFWAIATAGYGTWTLFDEIGCKLARSYWNAARSEHKMQIKESTAKADDHTRLPAHLSTLLELDSDDVLVDSIIQRSYNLAWNRSNEKNAQSDEPMDSVVEDFAIASPLDALAAWWSTLVVNQVLAHALDTPDSDTLELLTGDMQLAIQTAPPASFAQVRALVALAVLEPKDREAHLMAAMNALPLDQTRCHFPMNSSSPGPLINVLSENPLPPDVRIALTMAKCLTLSESPDHESRLRAAAGVNSLPLHGVISLLSFTASLMVLERFTADKQLLCDVRPCLECVAGNLRLWISRQGARTVGLSSKARRRIAQICSTASKIITGVAEPDHCENEEGLVTRSGDGSTVEREAGTADQVVSAAA
jgi:hypothetical protein